MSVMACERSGCEHVLCDRLILDGARYICEDCWDELLSLKDNAFTPGMTHADLYAFIEAFLASPRQRSARRIHTREDFAEAWDALCPSRSAPDE